MKIIYLVLVYYVVVMGNTSLVLSDLTIEEEQQLFDALQLALINNSTNLYKLQEMFYPPGEVSPDTVVFNSTVTVNTISNPDNYSCDQDSFQFPAFKNVSNHYVRFDSFIDHFSVSNDALSSSQAKLTFYINSIEETIEWLEYISYFLIVAIVNIQLSPYSSSTSGHEHTLHLKVDKLEVMPCEHEYIKVMNSVLSWVSTCYIINYFTNVSI